MQTFFNILLPIYLTIMYNCGCDEFCRFAEKITFVKK